MATRHLLYTLCLLCIGLLDCPSTICPHSIESTRVWLDNTKVRAILFGLYKTVFSLKSQALEMMLLDLPGLLFFSTYTLLILFWAEIYHQARSLPINKLRPAYFILNGAIYFTQVCIWIYIRLGQSRAAVEFSKIFFSVICFCTALGFLTYGGRYSQDHPKQKKNSIIIWCYEDVFIFCATLNSVSCRLFFMLRRFPIESTGRRKKLHEVGFVTGICCTCFLIRCFVVALSAFDEDADVDVLNHPILNFVYYMTVEIFPSALVLFILRKLPPRRISDQYHPIQKEKPQLFLSSQERHHQREREINIQEGGHNFGSP
ncbi:tobamovirus multiplication protein 1-like isoform X3 [Camellia sinensis]|uniref:tobamovirus multiplication protein 1-like isoform X3 n=1 Tax=Camellia sinensis TaxID=4442 RepID=UPI0010359B88|nr:tobamovirus multiplication protein 1-like isoform X3 [Camellia sinensis]XP_028094009.1 tobamovirus multiplication protein 1-like isoform X3 [Camellia sinensis]